MSTPYLTLEELEPLFEKEADELYTYLEIISRNPDDAGDLLQQVFMKFIEQVKKGHIRRETASHYLKRMARNEFYEKYRRGKKEIPLPEEIELKSDDTSARVEETSREIRIVMLEALSSDEMPDDIADILRMRFLKEMDVDSICAKAEKSRATVYRMMEKGLTVLAKAFEKAGLTLEDLEY